MSLPQQLGTDVVPGHSCTRWRRFGHDRLYVSTSGGEEDCQLGYRDLTSGVDHPSNPNDAAQLSAVADQWLRLAHVEVSAPPTASQTPWQDLSLNQPGGSAQSQATARRAEAPVRTTLARVLGVHTPERAWRIGAKGERLVADELAKLSRRDSRWTAIHAIPVGTRGADIDHLVLGPGGIFTLNTKHHPDAEVWVGGETFIVNGSRVPYIRNARHEAGRATRLLTQAAGRPVPVTGLVVPVGAKAPLTIKSQPRGVFVVARRDLVTWMSGQGQIWDAADLTAVWDVARRSSTWGS